ncbi:hypothetical protein LTR67_005299 [Exophiala xenobiotica]
MASTPTGSEFTREDIRKGKRPAKFQITDIAFNWVGKAMQDKSDPDRVPHEVIVARDHTTTNWGDIVKTQDTPGRKRKRASSAASAPPPYRTSMTLTMREQNIEAAPQAGTSHYLIVGYAKPGLDGSYKTQDSNKQIIGLERPETILPWEDTDHPTCYVVTPILDEQPAQLKYFVLLRPENDLCTPFNIAFADIFFRHEFRDETPNATKRKTTWKDLVAKHSVRVGLLKPASAKQEKFRRARHQGKVIVEPHEDLGMEMKILTLAFEKTGDPWLLKEMQALLERVDLDLEYRPLRQHVMISKWAQNDTVDFSPDHADQMVLEVAELWPDVQDVTAAKLLELRRLLHQHAGMIKLFQLKGLLAEGMFRLAKVDKRPPLAEITDEQANKDAAFVQDLCSTLDRMLGAEPQPKPTSSNLDANAELALVASIHAKHKRILSTYDGFSAKLNANFGDFVLEGAGPADFWAKYAESPDTDCTRTAFNHVVKFVIAELAHVQFDGLIKPIRDLVQVLDRLNLAPN